MTLYYNNIIQATDTMNNLSELSCWR